MGTTSELSAHLTVNVERQFYVWGSILQALLPYILAPEMRPKLGAVRDMNSFGMEGNSELAVFMEELGANVPTIWRMPLVLLNHTRSGLPFGGEALEIEWPELLSELQRVSGLPLWEKPLRLGKSKFKRAKKMIKKLEVVDVQLLRSSFEWVAGLLKASIKEMQDERQRAAAYMPR